MGRRIASALIFLIVIAGGSILYADDSVRLMVGRSTVVSIGAPIARVSLTSPDVADALVTAPTELLVNGKTPGTISMFVWDRAGAIRRYEIVVQRDLARLSEQMKELFPTENIQVQSNGRSIVLSGTVTNKDFIDRAINLASGYVEKKEEVVTLLQVAEGARSNQVLLRVRFAEVNRNAITELGASLFTGANGYKDYVGRTTTEQFAAPTFDSDGTNNKLVFSDFLNFFLFNTKQNVGALVKALQTRGLIQTLAEPNLVAESGKEASFLAGGEFPVPIAQGSTGGAVTVTVTYKEFGIRLNFTPVVNGDRIHLKVRPEVSALDFSNAVVLNGFRIPALTTRRTETELELQNGQTFAVAGLINNSMNKTLQKIPGIGDIPILGLLFQSQAAQKERTELVVMITPEILPNNSPGVTSTLPRTPETYLPPTDPKKLHDQPAPAFTPANRGMAGNSSAVPAPGAPTAAPATNAAASKPMTDKERKTQEKAAREQAKKDAEAAKIAAAAAKKQAALDKAAQETAAKHAAEQAKKDAEAAKKQAEIDKKNGKSSLDDATAKLKAAQAAYDVELAKKRQEQQY